MPISVLIWFTEVKKNSLIYKGWFGRIRNVSDIWKWHKNRDVSGGERRGCRPII